jgi:3-oxoadipate enol-lactonase
MAQQQTERGFLDVEGARLYYTVAGTGEPLLLIHAGVADSRMWDEQIPVFAQHNRVMCYDLPGFGRTELRAGSFAYYDQIAALLGTLGVERAHVVGISFGGKVALDFALSYPAMVASLVLIAPSVGGNTPSDDVRQFVAQEDALLEQGDLDGATELNVRMWVDGPYRTPEQVNPLVRERVREMQRHAFTIVEPEGMEERTLTPPAIMRLSEVTMPVFVLVGDQDIPSKVELAEQLEHAIPHARRVVIPGAAHMVTMEQPEVCSELILDFLRTL